MRFIDEKGRIFGLINIFDFLFITLIFVLLFTSTIFYYGRYKTKEEINYRHIYKFAKAKAYLISDVADCIKEGDCRIDSNGEILLEVEGIISNNPAFLEKVNKEIAADSKLHVGIKKSYAIGVPQSRGAIFLGGFISTVKGRIDLPSLREVELSLKVLCRTERNDALIMIVNSLPLNIGREIQISTPKYFASFTITDIIQDETR